MSSHWTRSRGRVSESRRKIVSRRSSRALEPLEERRLLAAYVWTGAASTDWADPTNWDLNNGTVPDDASDTVTIADLTNDPVLDSSRTIGSLSGAGPLDLSAFTLTVGDSSSTTYSGVLSGSGGLTKVGTGTLTLATQANTASGLLTVNAGGLDVGPGIPIDGAWAGNVTINGGQLRLLQSNVFNNASDFTINAPGQLNMNGFTDVIGNLQGDGDIVNNSHGTGIVLDDLNGTRTFSGNITGGGALLVRGNVASSGTQVLSGGTHTLNTFRIGRGTVTLDGGAALTTSGNAVIGTNRTGEIGGIAGGHATGVLNVLDGSLTASNIDVGNRDTGTVTATINHSGGTVTTTTGSGPDGSGIRVGHWPNTNASYNLSGTGVMTVGGGEAFGLAVDGNGTFLQTGGTLNASQVIVNTRNASGSGTFTQNGGVANIGAGGMVIAAGSFAVNLGGGTLRATADWSSPLAMALTGAVGNHVIDTNGFDVTLSGVLSGNGGLNKVGAGTLTLSGANTYSGITNVNTGELQITSATGLGSTVGGTVVMSSAQLQLAGGITVSGETATINGPAANNQGALNSAAGDNTWAGPVVLGNTSNTRIGVSAGSLTVSGVISGPTDLNIRNAASNQVVLLTGANTYGADTNVVVGTLRIGGGDDRLPTGSALTLGNGSSIGEATFDLNGQNQTVGNLSSIGNMPLTITNSGTADALLTVNQTGGTTYSGVIVDGPTNATSLTKTGGNVLTLSGNSPNTYTGMTTVSGGRLHLLKSTGTSSIPGDLTITSGGDVSFGSSNQIADSANVVMSGSGSTFNGSGINAGQLNGMSETIASLTVTGGAFNTATLGNWTVTGAASFTGGAGNTIFVGNSGSQATFGSLSITNMNATAGGNVNTNNSFTQYGNQTTGLSSITVGSGGLTLNGSRLNLRRGGAGALGSQLVLNGNVTTVGSATSAIVEDTAGGTTGALRVQLSGTAGAADRTFDVGGGGANLTVGVPIVDGAATPGSLTKSGPGTLTLSAVNTYTGTTTVDDGTLLVTGEIGNGGPAGPVTVAASATLAGNGTVNADVMSSGSVAPGLIPGSGILTTGGLDLGGSLTVDLNGLAPGSGHDQLVANGTVDLTSLPALALAGTLAPTIGDSITIIANDGNDDTIGSFAGLAEGAELPGPFNGATLYITYNGGDGNDVVLNTIPEVNGTSGDDTLIVTPLGGGDLQYELNGDAPVTLTAPPSFTFNGRGGNDAMTVVANGNALPAGGLFYNGNDPTGGPGDLLVVQGSGQDALYTPDAAVTGNGEVDLGAEGTITFTGLEPVDMTGMGTVTLSLPGDDDVVDIAEGLDAASGTFDALVLSGTSGGVAFEALHAWDNALLVVDTTIAADGDDSVTISGASNSHLNLALTIDTGAGADSVSVDGGAGFFGDVTITSQDIDVDAVLDGDNLTLTSGGPVDVSLFGSLGSTGDINIDSGGTTTIDGTVFAGGSLDVDSGGAIVVNIAAFVNTSFGGIDFTTTGGSITIDSALLSGDAVNFDSSDAISINSSITPGSSFSSNSVNDTTIFGFGSVLGFDLVTLTTTSGAIDVQSGGSVSSTSFDVILDSGSSVSIAGNVNALLGLVDIDAATTADVAGNISADVGILIDSGGAQTISGFIGPFAAEVTLTSGDSIGITGTVNANGTITVDSATDTTISGGSVNSFPSDVLIDAGGNFLLESSGAIDSAFNSEISAGGDLTLDVGTAISAINAVILSGGQSGGGSQIQVFGNVGSDSVVIGGGAGTDAIVVDDNGGMGGDGGAVENLPATAAVTIDGGGGDDSLSLDDSGSVDGDVIALDGTVTGLHETAVIDYENMESVEVFAGDFEDVFNVNLSPDTAFAVHGGDPVLPASPGDQLNMFTSDGMLDLPFVFAATTDGEITDAPDQPISWTSIESFTIDGEEFVVGDLYVETNDTANRIIFYSNDGVNTSVRIDNVVFGPFPITSDNRMVVFSQAGSDTIVVQGVLPPIAEFHGGDGNDYVVGTTGDDFLYGDLGNDIVLGGEGNNFIHGDNPDDPGAGGNDRLEGRSGADILMAGVGNDRLTGGAGDDTLDGGNGNDQVFGGLGDDFSYGGGDEGFDLIRDTLGNDVVLGGGGADILTGDRDHDLVIGGTGGDRLSGGSGDDYLANGSSSAEADIDAALALLATGDDSLFTANVLPALATWRASQSPAGFGPFVDDLAIDDISGGLGADIFDAEDDDFLRDVRATESDTVI